jgi:hypothetical protein
VLANPNDPLSLRLVIVLRAGLFVLLACLVLASTIRTTATITAAQSNPVRESGTELIRAFEAVQKADSLGAPPDQVASLSSQLNTALEDYNEASQLSSEGNTTGAEYFSILANQTSTSVTSQAIVLQNVAESDKTNGQLIAYATAMVAAAVSAFTILEAHRIPNFLRKRKLLKTKLREVNQGEP